ncbi:hypothetical protein AAFF_G00021290 [Aldrovandia affinis]|uniref:Uncharacterized protein n=1 Tax=Aldrovandia affinis TaxID=143900 RepID=A0AAD7S5S8_9TELE|nr:hypothetical protein AAFF_G00021290 [Aldrovandia affinis]
MLDSGGGDNETKGSRVEPVTGSPFPGSKSLMKDVVLTDFPPLSAPQGTGEEPLLWKHGDADKGLPAASAKRRASRAAPFCRKSYRPSGLSYCLTGTLTTKGPCGLCVSFKRP